ncbi:MAG: DUF1015 family protein [Planctomycetota bacterium]
MLRIRPFRALRPAATLASRVASVPYDVVNTKEARELADGNPQSFLHVIRPEIDLPDNTHPYDDSVYDKARENLDRFFHEGVLVEDDAPGIYLYRQVMDHRAQVGVVCCCHVDDYANNVIKKHEKTRPDKEDDRTRHTLTLEANTGPVFMTFRDQPDVMELMAHDMNQRPIYHFDAPDGVTHTVWRAENPDDYVRAFGSIEAAYVADGHHRSASAARAGAELNAAHPDAGPDAEFNWFLSVLFPASELQILAYNRVVKDLNGMTTDAVREALAATGTLEPTDQPVPADPASYGVYLDGSWYRLTIDPASIDRTDPIGSLDVSLLQDRVLTPILNVGDPRTDQRIDFVGGIRGADELKRRVDAGDAAIAFFMYPTSIEQLLAVSDADMVMPPKSTWFEPKLRSGLFVHRLCP